MICHPEGHATQTVDPGVADVGPIQLSHKVVLPSILLNVSFLQSLQLFTPGLPFCSVYFPGAHLLHSSKSDSPTTDEYVPGGHARQTVFEMAPVTFDHNPGRHETQLDIPDKFCH